MLQKADKKALHTPILIIVISNDDSGRIIVQFTKRTQNIIITTQRFKILIYLMVFGTSKDAIIFSPFNISEICKGTSGI